jgi:hypothetical protein
MEALIHEWQLTSFAEGGAMQSARPPETCPVCGSDRVKRILWGWVCLTPEQRGEVEAGRAILGGRRRDADGQRPGTADDPQQSVDAPEWVCLDCQPVWDEIHRVAIEVDGLQEAKEKALIAQDFALAAVILRRQDVFEARITELARRLKDGEPGA